MSNNIKNSATKYIVSAGAILLLGACGSGNTAESGSSAKAADMGKAQKTFKSARGTMLSIKKIEPETNCDAPTIDGYPARELITCGGEGLKVFAVANEDRTEFYRLTFFNYRLTDNDRVGTLLKSFKMNEKDAVTLVEKAFRSNGAQTQDIGKYRLTASQSGDDMRIAIYSLSDVRAKEKAIADSPLVRRAAEINTKADGTRLTAIAYAYSDLASLDPKYMSGLAQFNNAGKFKDVKGNEFKEPEYFEKLISAWDKQKANISRDKITQSYDAFLGAYDLKSESFPVFRSQYASLNNSGPGITIGNNPNVQMPVSLDSVVDAAGERISMSTPQIFLIFTENLDVKSIPMPKAAAQKLVENSRKIGDFRPIKLEVSGRITDVSVAKDRIGWLHKVSMGYQPEAISVKSPSDETLFHSYPVK